VIPPQLLPSSEFTTTLCNSDRVMALRACLLVFTVTCGNIIPDDLQLQAGLVAATGKESFVIVHTGWEKTLCITIPILLDPCKITITISPLK
ncbi:hypothetical protein C8J57DRAFT_1012347, partial [Mycena rebaudengoi]